MYQLAQQSHVCVFTLNQKLMFTPKPTPEYSYSSICNSQTLETTQSLRPGPGHPYKGILLSRERKAVWVSQQLSAKALRWWEGQT